MSSYRQGSVLGFVSCFVLAGLSPVSGHAVESVQACPDTVVLAAGSDQNEEYGEYFGPQRYSENAELSNGYEGPNITALFHSIEQRSQRRWIVLTCWRWMMRRTRPIWIGAVGRRR